MSERLFAEAMGELSDKYITEAIKYRGKKGTRVYCVLFSAHVHLW